MADFEPAYRHCSVPEGFQRASTLPNHAVTAAKV